MYVCFVGACDSRRLGHDTVTTEIRRCLQDSHGWSVPNINYVMTKYYKQYGVESLNLKQTLFNFNLK